MHLGGLQLAIKNSTRARIDEQKRRIREYKLKQLQDNENDEEFDSDEFEYEIDKEAYQTKGQTNPKTKKPVKKKISTVTTMLGDDFLSGGNSTFASSIFISN